MSKLEVQIPEQMITDAVRAAMVEQLCKGNPEKFVEAIVKGAMEAKDSQGYRSETLFQKEAGKMIRDAAVVVFREWLEQNTELLREKLMLHLNTRKQAHMKSMVEGICGSIKQYGAVSAVFKIKYPDPVKTQPERLIERFAALEAFYNGVRAGRENAEQEHVRQQQEVVARARDSLAEASRARDAGVEPDFRFTPRLCRCRGLGLHHPDGAPVPHVVHLARRCHG